MPVELIERLLADFDPAFACYANSDSSRKEAFVVPLTHLANPPAGRSFLKLIPSVPGADSATALYSTYDGVLLYTEPDTFSEGIEIFPIGEWEQRTAQMVESWVEDGADYPDDDMPYGHNDFIAFAHSRGASSYIHWVIRGPRAGSIYWWPWTMRPEKDTPPMATDFAAFIRLIYEKPAYFFNDLLLCYTRFSDGRTMIEWLPSRYLPDRNNPISGR